MRLRCLNAAEILTTEATRNYYSHSSRKVIRTVKRFSFTLLINICTLYNQTLSFKLMELQLVKIFYNLSNDFTQVSQYAFIIIRHHDFPPQTGTWDQYEWHTGKKGVPRVTFCSMPQPFEQAGKKIKIYTRNSHLIPTSLTNNLYKETDISFTFKPLWRHHHNFPMCFPKSTLLPIPKSLRNDIRIETLLILFIPSPCTPTTPPQLSDLQQETLYFVHSPPRQRSLSPDDVYTTT